VIVLDLRSPLAVKIIEADPRAYEVLVVEGGTPDLAHELLENVQPDQLLAAAAALPVAPYAMLAGLWLWHDGLDECHQIVQKSPGELYNAAPKGDDQQLRDMTSTLAFWHAIMHRREGDFSNSKYWYARAASHPVLEALGNQAGAIVNSFPADNSVFRIIANGWKPAALVDLAEAVHESPNDHRHAVAVRLQQLEWRLLFDFCARA
jgi:hypothetical protein